MDNKSNIHYQGRVCAWKCKNQKQKQGVYCVRQQTTCLANHFVVSLPIKLFRCHPGGYGGEGRACDSVLSAVTAGECSVGPRQQLELNQSYKTHLTLTHTHTLCLWLARPHGYCMWFNGYEEYCPLPSESVLLTKRLR